MRVDSDLYISTGKKKIRVWHEIMRGNSHRIEFTHSQLNGPNGKPSAKHKVRLQWISVSRW